jgi:putative drug exporter of the RND superfamily
MAGAIAVDATIVWTVLVSAVMKTLAERSCWLPRWLDRLIPARYIARFHEA